MQHHFALPFQGPSQKQSTKSAFDHEYFIILWFSFFFSNAINQIQVQLGFLIFFFIVYCGGYFRISYFSFWVLWDFGVQFVSRNPIDGISPHGPRAEILKMDYLGFISVLSL